MDTLKNLWADIAGGEKIGFLDASQQSLYSTLFDNAFLWSQLTPPQSLLLLSRSTLFSGSK
jgi:hypothetical protein